MCNQLISKLGQHESSATDTEPSKTSGISSETDELLRTSPEMLELILSMIKNLPNRINEISNAISNKDFIKASMAAHSTRGAMGSIGFLDLNKSFGKIEHAANKEDENTIRGEFEHLNILIEEANQLEDQLRSVVFEVENKDDR